MVVNAQMGKSGEYGTLRDVYIESRAKGGDWQTDIFDLCKPAVPFVTDLIRWAESIRLEVVYDPPGHMAEYFRDGREDDVQDLFT